MKALCMFKHKKNICMMILLCIMCISVSGCSSKEKKDDKITVLCTIFPQYDWLHNITKDTENIEISLLVRNGSDLHNYQPSVDDIVKISECDVFIFVGGESDGWVYEAIEQSDNKDMIAINMMELIGSLAKEEDHDEEDVHEHHEHDIDGLEHDKDEIEYDEHIWLSLRNAQLICEEISDCLCSIDSEESEKLSANCKAYVERLNELDERYINEINSASQKVVLFGDRFPFKYMMEDYGIEYYAAFVGCSAQSEASFYTIARLSKLVDSFMLDTVFIVDETSRKLAETIVDSSKRAACNIVRIDSMQSVTQKQIDEGLTYYDTMEENLRKVYESLK